MKLLYNINKVIIGINLILIVIPFFALLFMTITGIVQVISYLVVLTMWKRTDPSTRKYLSMYPFLVGLSLGILYIGTDTSYAIAMCIAAILAIGFLFILKKQKDLPSKITTDEL
ncbi:hypothetical protein ACFO3O_20185 [Dokdonia ponticola]|uniref:Uncharacterized protein n=1 Tax=Dokdonia ponticola TaxID=2041041 RepID=A0ABV9I299_9FLAO